MSTSQTLRKWAGNRTLFAGLILLVNVILWAIPANVVELVAREQHVLCGRYSRTQFAWIMGVAILSAIALFIRMGRDARDMRRRCFAIAACFIALVPCALVADIALRLRTDYPYQTDAVVYHRPPGKIYHLPYEDLPEAKRSYPVVRAGFGKVDCTLSYDSKGFRNAAVPASSEIVTVGDSFTEGSRVSDDQCWPAVLGRLSHRQIYNLGISGYNPPEYLAAVKTYGLQLKPKFVFCMLYEGNDFRTGEVEAKAGVGLKQIIRTSPLLLAINDAMIRLFGPINAKSAVSGLDILSWMPVACPEGPNSKFYAFAPKQLIELNVTPQEFSASEEWFAAKGVLRQMDEACRANGSRLIVAYAPNKAHVVFPLAAKDLPAEKVRAYAAIRARKQPPEATEFMRQLLTNLESREQVIAEWCASRSIPFVSTTPALRDAVRAGRQPYYTYDQHWSPAGHEVAAATIQAALNSLPGAVARAAE